MDDPIFAAIEAYRRADREIADADTAFQNASHDPGPNPWRKRYAAADKAYRKACTEMAATIPTTIAGAAALIDLYVGENPWAWGGRPWHEYALVNLSVALKRLAIEISVPKDISQ